MNLCVTTLPLQVYFEMLAKQDVLCAVLCTIGTIGKSSKRMNELKFTGNLQYFSCMQYNIHQIQYYDFEE